MYVFYFELESLIFESLIFAIVFSNILFYITSDQKYKQLKHNTKAIFNYSVDHRNEEGVYRTEILACRNIARRDHVCDVITPSLFLHPLRCSIFFHLFQLFMICQCWI